MFDVGKTRMIDEKNCDDILSLFHLVPKRNGQTDGQTDRRTDLLYQYRASVCWRTIKMCVWSHYDGANGGAKTQQPLKRF